MATFNPDPQPVAVPDWLGLSKPTTQIDANLSRAKLFSGIADAVTEGASGIDKTMKDVITDTAENKYTPIQDQYLSTLQTVDSSVRGGKAPDLFATYTPIPQSVQSGIDRVSTLESAKANGSLSNTAYLAKLYSTLKDLRAEYPGYRSYVDRESARITGKDVANDYMSSLVSDANSYITQARAEKEKIGNQFIELENTGHTEAPRMHDLYDTGQLSTSQARVFIANEHAAKANYETIKQNYEINKMGKDVDKENALDLLDKITTKGADSYWNSVSIGSSTADQASVLDKVQKGEPVSPEDAQAMVAKVAAAKERARVTLMKDVQDPANGLGGKPLSTWAGADATKNMVADKLSNYDHVMDLLNNKEYGAVASATNAITAINSTNKLSLYKDVNMGRWWQLNDIVGQMGGSEATKEMTRAFLAQGLPKYLAPWVQMQDFGAGSGQGAGPGTSSSLLGSVNAASEAGLKPSESPKTYNALIGIVEHIADPNVSEAQKVNYIKYAFSPANGGLISKFEMDSPDPNDPRKTLPGQYSIFSRMMSSDILNNVYKLSQKGHPELWKQAKSWAQQTFGRELFADQLAHLSSIEDRRIPIIAWNPEESRFKTTIEPRQTNDSNYKQYISSVQAVLSKVNSGLYTISNIAKTEGKGPADVNSYLLNTMQELRALNVMKVQGLPEQMYRSVADQKKNQATYEENLRQKYKKDQSRVNGN